MIGVLCKNCDMTRPDRYFHYVLPFYNSNSFNINMFITSVNINDLLKFSNILLFITELISLLFNLRF